MKNERKTKKVLIEELNVLRKQINMLIQRREEQGVLLESNKESDKILRALLSNHADAFVLVDTKGALLDFNETTARRLGKTPEAIIGASVYDLLPKDVAKLMKAKMVEAVQTRSPVRFENEHGNIWNDNILNPILDEQGNVVKISLHSHDITGLKRMEKEFRKSEYKYRELIENLNDVVYSVDHEGRITYVSPVVEKILGYSPEEIIGRHLTELIHTDDLIFTYYLHPCEYRFVNKSGEICWLRSSCRPLARGGKIIGIAGVLSDVNEQKRIQDRLRESEENYRVLAENVSDVIWSVDMDLNFTYVSPSVERLLGWKAEELRLLHVRDITTPESFQFVTTVFAQDIAIEQLSSADPYRSRTIEVEQYRKDGSTLWTELKARFLRDQEGKLKGVIGVTRDISLRKQAEDILRESEIKYSTLVENAIEGIAIIQDGIIKYANPSLLSLSGHSLEEVLDSHFSEWVHPDDLHRVLQRYADRVAGKTIFDPLELRIICKNKEVKHMEGLGAPAHFAGSSVTLIFLRDISKLKKAEMKIIELKKELDNANRKLGIICAKD